MMRLSLVLCTALSIALPACRGCGDAVASRSPGTGSGAALDKGALPDTEVTCPVCGLVFDARESTATRVHNGVTYFFLLEDHARAFAASPETYLAPAKP